ncbi:DUF4870 domain-containing protein [Brachybacterium sacelli]|uniref:Tic20 family protein n=1 Tax=Brachybacterium sacelli TaxID=173364 RepID=A0ABS4X6U9_9MICO|nr:DUF4870 domain-containing protein [Brachybacterium sacelli]MBP2384178.1 putative Tic20 family protein [Brachybacterium sacelli]
MSQTPHPHDPYGSEPGDSAPEQQSPGWTAAPQDVSGQQGEAEQDQASPTSDPALHPHDPYAYDPPAPQDGSAPEAGGHTDGSPSAGPDPYGAAPGQQSASGYPGQPGHQGPYGGSQDAYAAPGPVDLNTPPAGFKGIYEGSLSGQGMKDSDAKTWALVVHLAALLQFIIPFVGGLIAQIVLFVLFKGRHRFVRYNAAEALNGTLAALIISLAMGAVFTVITIVTFGIGAFLFGLMFLPTLVQAIFAIIGAVKAYQGEWWNYPANLRLVK